MKLALFLAVAGSALVASGASAQQAANPTSQIGRVVSVEGPADSVLVFRGSQSYSLAAGDLLFEGDRVFTRTNGKAVLSTSGCQRELPEISSVVVDEEFCEAELALLDPQSADLAPQSAPVGAAVNLLPLLLVTGAGAGAAAINSGGPSGSSPQSVSP